MNEDQTQPTLYVVVCTKMHGALGPFASAKLALKVARDETANSACVYVPVPLLLGPDAKIERVDQETGGRGHSGQYL